MDKESQNTFYMKILNMNLLLNVFDKEHNETVDDLINESMLKIVMRLLSESGFVNNCFFIGGSYMSSSKVLSMSRRATY